MAEQWHIHLGAGFVPVRKKGKLPASTISETYLLEYGEDCVEMHADAVNANDVVLIHDDLLATGGTAFATLQMVKRMKVKDVYFSFICDLEFIKTESKEENNGTRNPGTCQISVS